MDEVAYNYIRFSDAAQSRGDSLRRQDEGAREWCRRRGVRLDDTEFRDLGRSAFLGEHRTNPDRHALARFLSLVERGKVARGSYLVIENLDRLSREHIRPALTLLLSLIEKGVRIVQLRPAEVVFDEQVDPMQLMLAIVELSRGHSESRLKSERVGAAWAQRRKRAREGRGLLTRRLPAWLREEGGRLVADPARAEAVRLIFRLAGEGMGLHAVANELEARGVPAFGRSGRWQVSYLHALLRDRRALGEMQPRGRGGAPDGPPVAGYFPAVVGEAEWGRARAGALERFRRPGRTAWTLNVFAGLVRGARDGCAYVCSPERGSHGPYRSLRSTAPRSGRGSPQSFPMDVFDRGVLGLLAEIDPAEVAPDGAGAGEVERLGEALRQAREGVALLEGELDARGESAALFRRLRAREAEVAELERALAEAESRAADPLRAGWAEARGLLAALDAAPDPRRARLLLRSALRRAVLGILILVVPRGRVRLCAAQVRFRGGLVRDYLIVNRPASKHTQPRWVAFSLAPAASYDLRDREQVCRLEGYLEAFPLPDWDSLA